ncbi:hypothetical protein SLEP1_g16558 [Rubroshorea leprosula]|uniref:Uncharacterized protein n=1 Tax=Rubroshorea leprosula TaxID=152421 RepID=A0AAV5J0I5_9ROSI|nr:hypothetical protein SLEP1_g16558 [Rubroshorea leprosula]
MKSNCMVKSRFSGIVSLSCTGLRLMGSNEDCLPKLNRWLFLRGSSDVCRVNWRLKVRMIDPVENCREMPRLSCATIFSITAFLYFPIEEGEQLLHIWRLRRKGECGVWVIVAGRMESAEQRSQSSKSRYGARER